MSDCEVSLDSYDGDSPEIWDVRIVRARKQHTCCECQRPIPVGTRYQRINGKWEGVFERFRSCLDCAEIADALGGGARLLRCLWDELEWQLPEVRSPAHCLSKLKTPSAKAYFSERWLRARS